MEKKYILSCVNGFKPSEAIVNYGCWASKLLNQPLKLFHTLDHQIHKNRADLSGSIGIGSQETLIKEWVEIEHEHNQLLQRKGNLILKSAKEQALNNGLGNIKVCLRKGKLLENIQSLNDKISLVLIGKFGEHHQNLENKFSEDINKVGHKVEAIVRKVEKPVLIVSKEFIKPTSICLAYDGSKGAIKALNYFSKLQNTVFNSIDVHLVFAGEHNEKNLLMLEHAKSSIKNSEAQIFTKIISGTPYAAIKEYIKQNNISLLSMGAFGHHWFHDFVMGSFTSQIIKGVQIPILLLR